MLRVYKVLPHFDAEIGINKTHTYGNLTKADNIRNKAKTSLWRASG